MKLHVDSKSIAGYSSTGKPTMTDQNGKFLTAGSVAVTSLIVNSRVVYKQVVFYTQSTS